VVDSTVKGGVGIDVATMGLHFFADLRTFAFLGAFEEQVFQIVRKTASNVGPFMNAAGFYPDLGRDEFREVVGNKEEGQAIFKLVAMDFTGKKFIQYGSVFRRFRHEGKSGVGSASGFWQKRFGEGFFKGVTIRKVILAVFIGFPKDSMFYQLKHHVSKVLTFFHIPSVQ